MKILVANRGEIAVRLMRACREMGLPSVAVYADCDRTAPHVRYADEAVRIGGNEPARSYLRIEAILDAARTTGATAVHPGYGFLAENAEFARACRDAGLVFIGPRPDVIELMGGKTAARDAAARAGVPVVPGTSVPLAEGLGDDEVRRIATEVGFPLFVKAVAGGGGKGMRIVSRPEDLAGAMRAARSEAQSAFGEGAIYFERQLDGARHVEIQLLGDEHGTVVPFVERECSIQRRHQKLLEEAPSVAVTVELRHALASAAAALARGVGYTSAGTIEFLLDTDGRFYFLEMNTRLQVEHPVTEMVTGLDLAQWQIRIARGERLTIDPAAAVTPRGHAIECRIYAEDPDAAFMPSPGLIGTLRSPAGPGVREDSGVAAGFEVPVFYDSMISKIIVWGANRAEAIQRMSRALEEYEVGGVKTTIPFFRWLLTHPDYLAGRIDTTFLDRALADRQPGSFGEVPPRSLNMAVVAAALHAFLRVQGAAGASAAPSSNWKRAARVEGLRSTVP